LCALSLILLKTPILTIKQRDVQQTYTEHNSCYVPATRAIFISWTNLRRNLKTRNLSRDPGLYNGTLWKDKTSVPPSLMADNIDIVPFNCSSPCHALVNHKRKFILVKHAKTGGTTLVRELLEPQLCNILQILRKNKKLTCARAGKPKPWVSLFSYNASQRIRLWEEYLTVSLIRDPFSRAKSAFNYLDAEKYLTWEEFSRKPTKLIDLVPEISKRSVAAHIQPQCPCTFDSVSGEQFVNLLISMNRFHEGAVLLIEKINERNPNLTPLKLTYKDRNVKQKGGSKTTIDDYTNICGSYRMDLPYNFCQEWGY